MLCLFCNTSSLCYFQDEKNEIITLFGFFTAVGKPILY